MQTSLQLLNLAVSLLLVVMLTITLFIRLLTPRRPHQALTWREVRMQRLLMLILLLISAWTLCGCGTAPSLDCRRTPVPVELLQEPQEPVPLIPVSPSTTPGTTKPSTR